MNKVLVVNAVLFYKECWTCRNEWYYNEGKQRSRVIKWYEEVKRKVEENEPPQVKMFVRRNKINVQSCSIETIKKWIYNVTDLSKKVERLPKGNIRRFIENR